MNINYMTYYIPENKVSVNDIIDCYEKAELPKEFNDKQELSYFFERFIGLNEVYIDNNIDEVELIDRAFRKMDIETKLSLCDIELIIDFSCDSFFKLKNCGHYIKSSYGLKNANVINMSGNLCANLDVALSFFSKQYISQSQSKILFCGGCKIPPKKRLAGSFSIMGDSYGIMIVDFVNHTLELIDSEIQTVEDLYKEQESENQALLMSQMHVNCLSALFARHDKKQIKKVFIPNGFPLLIIQSLKYIGFEENIIYTKNISKGHFAYLDSLINMYDFISDNPDFKGQILVISISYSGTIVGTIYNKINETD
uniref:hypothetical protein n=1 Tax=Bacteroides ovatus TaxID=28116 RepID=UPI00359C7398